MERREIGGKLGRETVSYVAGRRIGKRWLVQTMATVDPLVRVTQVVRRAVGRGWLGPRELL